MRPPNILLFLCDDLGWQDSSVAMNGVDSAFQERYRTPNLERLAARGMRFSNAYASAPVCTPTRTSILTGKSPARTHITYWTLNKDSDTSRKHDRLSAPAWQVNGLQPGQHETLAEILTRGGYRTLHVGKAHFGVHDTPGSDPRNLGFQGNIAGHASGAPGSFLGKHHFTVAGRQGKEPGSAPSPWDVPGLEAYHGEDIFLTEALAQEACQAIEACAQEGVPFFINFAPYAVHTPIMANAKFAKNYPQLDERENAYATMIETYDAALGRLVETLKANGQLDNTVILFHSDNGGLSAHARGVAPDGKRKNTHNAPLRSGKGSCYEGGTRVPLIIAWPGITGALPWDNERNIGSSNPSQTASDIPVVSHDLFPTVLAIAGLESKQPINIDGQDLVPILMGQPERFDQNRTLLWNQPHQWGAKGPGIEPFTSIRQGPWKLIFFHADRRLELYHLERDLGETQNIAAQHPEQLRACVELLRREMQRLGGQYSIENATGKEIAGPAASF